jgi:DNA-binding MurR/RpiR family transcriptional regulator
MPGKNKDQDKENSKEMDPTEIQNMLNVNINELQQTINNIDFKQLALIINMLKVLTKNKSNSSK